MVALAKASSLAAAVIAGLATGFDIYLSGSLGASVVAQANCARLLRIDGPKEFADAGKGPTGRKDIAESHLKVPDVMFDDSRAERDGRGESGVG